MTEYREKYPDKAVTYFSQQFPQMGWAVLMGGGSLPNIPIRTQSGNALQQTLLNDICLMNNVPAQGCVALGNKEKGYLLYSQSSNINIEVAPGKYQLFQVNAKTGEITSEKVTIQLSTTFKKTDTSPNKIYWLRKK